MQSRKAPFRLYLGANLFHVLQDHLFTNVPTKLLGSDPFRKSSFPSIFRVLPVLLESQPWFRNYVMSPSLGRVHALCHTICLLCEDRSGLPFIVFFSFAFSLSLSHPLHLPYVSVQVLRLDSWLELFLAPYWLSAVAITVLSGCPFFILNEIMRQGHASVSVTRLPPSHC